MGVDVYLVRHAIAERRDFVRWPNDDERPLTPRGIARFQSAARGLGRIVREVEVVLASPYTRAWKTAEILHDEIAWPVPERCPDLEASRAPRGALDVLLGMRDRSSAAFVGHEPYLSRLASLLLSGEENAINLELKKGAVALLTIAGDPRPGGVLLRWSVTPKILRWLDPGRVRRRGSPVRVRQRASLATCA
jgi:phosphohistidine phosphatase